MSARGTALRARCCIVGGGPAGIMLGLLLARSGVPVVVLEKHADFLRDFRGDTIHPSTLDLMAELGLLDALLALPHQKVGELGGQIGDTFVPIADFRRLSTRCKFLALMPQWDFLNFLSERARAYPAFELRLEAAAHDLIHDGDRIVGVRAATPAGPLEVYAELVVGADGRHSIVRERAGLPVVSLGAPIDVLWFRLPREANDPSQTFGRVDFGKILVMLDRGTYWQCGYVIRKEGFAEIRGRGLDAFRRDLVALAPYLRDRAGDLRSWDEVKLLTVLVDRLERWHRPGLLCIGDAAHAMSPLGGVGINLAIQDAVAAANALVPEFGNGAIPSRTLESIQRRRAFAADATQRVQVFLAHRVLERVLRGSRKMKPPAALQLFARLPALRRIPARLIGVGVRPEHIRTPVVAPPRS